MIHHSGGSYDPCHRSSHCTCLHYASVYRTIKDNNADYIMSMHGVYKSKRFCHTNVAVATFQQRSDSYRCNFSRDVNLPHDKLSPYKEYD